jgi:hypothetical protein
LGLRIARIAVVGIAMGNVDPSVVVGLEHVGDERIANETCCLRWIGWSYCRVNVAIPRGCVGSLMKTGIAVCRGGGVEECASRTGPFCLC